MIDRTIELTEALAWVDSGPTVVGAKHIIALGEAARMVRDFPTDEQVEAAALAFAGLDSWDETREVWGLNHAMPKQWRSQARAALEAVRQVMIEDNQ